MSETYVHPGSEMLGQRVTFQLKHSSLANAFNVDWHEERLVGVAKLAFDGYVNVSVPGWRFGHRVPAQHLTLAAPDTRPYVAKGSDAR